MRASRRRLSRVKNRRRRVRVDAIVVAVHVSSRARLRSPRRRRRWLPPRGGCGHRNPACARNIRRGRLDARRSRMAECRLIRDRQPISDAGAESHGPGESGRRVAQHARASVDRRARRVGGGGDASRVRVDRSRPSRDAPIPRFAIAARSVHADAVLGKKRTSAPRRELGLRSARRERARERRRRHAAHRLVQLCRLGGLRAG